MNQMPPTKIRKWQEINALTLAYLGDAVYELWVRKHLLELGYFKLKELNRVAVSYVRASAQARILEKLFPALEEEEEQVVRRGRNAKGGHPKNVDVLTYRHATAFESLIGYWYLEGREDRLEWAFAQVDSIIREMSISEEKAGKSKVNELLLD